MANVYNKVGSLKTVLSHLNRHNISDIQSIDDVVNFQKQFHITRKHIILDHEHQLSHEKNLLTEEIPELEKLIHSRKTEIEFEFKQKTENIETKINDLPEVFETDWQALKYYWTKIYFKLVFGAYSLFAKLKIYAQIRNPIKQLEKKNKRYRYLNNQFEDAVKSSAKRAILELERKKKYHR